MWAVEAKGMKDKNTNNNLFSSLLTGKYTTISENCRKECLFSEESACRQVLRCFPSFGRRIPFLVFCFRILMFGGTPVVMLV